MTWSDCDLRRLGLHGLIERIPHSRRDRVTALCYSSAMFGIRDYIRLTQYGLAVVGSREPLNHRLAKRRRQN